MALRYVTYDRVRAVCPIDAVEAYARGIGKTVQQVVELDIEEAADVVDCYAAARYTVPFVPVPTSVMSATEAIAAYYVTLRAMGESDEVRHYAERAKIWLDLLKAVANRKAILAGANASLLVSGVIVTDGDEIPGVFVKSGDIDTLKNFTNKGLR